MRLKDGCSHLYNSLYIPGLREPDLMVKMAGLVTDDLELIRSAIYATVNP